jgi:hypothetical protein
VTICGVIDELQQQRDIIRPESASSTCCRAEVISSRLSIGMGASSGRLIDWMKACGRPDGVLLLAALAPPITSLDVEDA